MRVLYFQYTNPAAYPPLEHSSRILADRGWQVLFLGTGSFGADDLAFPPHERITIKRMKFCPPGWRQKLHYMRFGLWVLGWTLWWRPRWVYASDPLSCPIAWLLSHVPGLRIIYHEHDPPESSADSVFMRWVLWTRKQLALRAHLCIFPNEMRAQQYNHSTGRAKQNRYPTITVWNCPRRDEAQSQKNRRNGDMLYLWFHGSIGPNRLPESVFWALSRLPYSIMLYIAGYETIGNVGYVDYVKRLALHLGILERVIFLGALPNRHMLLQECKKADVGLSLYMDSIPMMGASNKPFDYLACGLALLVPDLPDWRSMYVERGYGLACDPKDPDSIAEALRWFWEHKEEMRLMGERGRRQIIEKWNYENLFDQALKIIET